MTIYVRALKTHPDVLRKTSQSRIETFAVEAGFINRIEKEPSLAGPGQPVFELFCALAIKGGFCPLIGELLNAQKEGRTARSFDYFALMPKFFSLSARGFGEQNDASAAFQLFPTEPPAYTRPPKATDVQARLLVLRQRNEKSVKGDEVHVYRFLERKRMYR